MSFQRQQPTSSDAMNKLWKGRVGFFLFFFPFCNPFLAFDQEGNFLQTHMPLNWLLYGGTVPSSDLFQTNATNIFLNVSINNKIQLPF